MIGVRAISPYYLSFLAEAYLARRAVDEGLATVEEALTLCRTTVDCFYEAELLRESDEGGLVLTLDVCHDAALRSWILSWGASARVVSPASLAAEIRADLTNATAQYQG